MVVKLPEHFFKNEYFKMSDSREVSIVDYKIYSSNEKVYAYSEHNLIIFILNGKKHIKIFNSDVVINKGEFIFIKKGNYIMNQIIDTESDNFESLIITLSDAFIKDFVRKNISLSCLSAPSQYEGSNKLNSFKYPLSPYLKSEINALLANSFKKTEYARKVSELKIEEVMLVILDENDVDSSLRSYLVMLSSIQNHSLKDFMENNFDKPLSIEDFAKESGNSLTSFKRYFKNVFNNTPRSWINRRRIEKAQHILQYSELNITETCYSVGYNNLSHFIKLFKEVTGFTPNTYRNKYKIGR